MSTVVFVNVFFPKTDEDTARLVESLRRTTEEVIRQQSGFISADLHVQRKGATIGTTTDTPAVINIAHWRTEEDFKRALATPEMLAHREEIRGLIERRDGYLTDCVYQYDNTQPEGVLG
jgi:quinol monooxygenase YgiN